MTENTNKIMELYAFATNNGITINEITIKEQGLNKDIQSLGQQIILGIKVNKI